MASRKKKKVVVAVSGGFDPVHVGHVRLFNRAKKLGDELVVILNNDNWLKQKKGYVFMPERERRELIAALRVVDRVVLTRHRPGTKDMTVCVELRRVRPNIFANGGDRTFRGAELSPEGEVCRKIGCRRVYNVGHGGKVQSSSWLVKNLLKRGECYCGSKKKFKHCHTP